MKINAKHALLSYVIGLSLIGFTVVAQAQDQDMQSMEKCYGIAKAGQNDCDPAATTCDKSVIDGDPNFYMYVPKGFCNKIVGGLTMINSNANSAGSLTTIPAVPSASSTAPATMPATTPATTGTTGTTGTTPAGMPAAPSMPDNSGMNGMSGMTAPPSTAPTQPSSSSMGTSGASMGMGSSTGNN